MRHSLHRIAYCKTYHLWLEHELALVDIQSDVAWDARELHVDALPCAPLSDLTELEPGQHLRVYQRFLFRVFISIILVHSG